MRDARGEISSLDVGVDDDGEAEEETESGALVPSLSLVSAYSLRSVVLTFSRYSSSFYFLCGCCSASPLRRTR